MRSPVVWLREFLALGFTELRREELERAQRLREQGRYEESRCVLAKWVRFRPGDREAQRRLRELPMAPELDRERTLWAEGREADAERILRELLARFPLEPEPHLRLAATVVDDDIDAMSPLATRAAELAPDDPHVLVRAAAMLRWTDRSATRALLERARSLVADMPPGEFAFGPALLHQEGDLLYEEGDEEAGLALMEQAFAADPNWYGHGDELAQAYLHVGRWRDALDVIARALEFFPENEVLLRRRDEAEEMGGAAQSG